MNLGMLKVEFRLDSRHYQSPQMFLEFWTFFSRLLRFFGIPMLVIGLWALVKARTCSKVAHVALPSVDILICRRSLLSHARLRSAKWARKRKSADCEFVEGLVSMTYDPTSNQF